MNKDTNDTVITSDENGFEYYLDITNNGPATATNIKVIDKIPQYVEAFNGRAETTIIADSNSSDDYSCDVDGADVNCTLSKIDVNDTVRVRIGVYGAKATGVRINSATAFSTTIADSNRSNNEGNVSVDVQSTADIMVSKNDVTFASEDEFIYAGTNGLYTIQVINNGSAEANFIMAWSLVNPGDEVILMLPNYMQVPGLAKIIGADIKYIYLQEQSGWHLDMNELRSLLTNRTKLISICNPSNLC